MNLITRLQKNIAKIEANGDDCLASLISLANLLNYCHKDFWNKNDEDLLQMLQSLYDSGDLTKVFEDHEFYAGTINAMLARYGNPAICNTGVLRSFTVQEGVVVLDQIQQPEPAPVEPEPAPTE